ncbi:tetratricopeptide repeat protein [Erythrobacter tepidarius]|uniref:tetratricopeptide repeat protein n=1 Tax=Erythrobacter tepidarius TaxID=60454 RepID=UPI001302729B|nr:tetratricopeptide repeat protein [Erythrobacter tepidarius]
MSVTLFALALMAFTPQAAGTGTAMASPPQAGELAAQTLAAGREDEALAVLQRASAADPHDPAVLINLGIAYAHKGEDAKARAAFEAALACREVVELDTADGSTTDSRRLARKALRMLERGEFRPRSEQLTYRD